MALKKTTKIASLMRSVILRYTAKIKKKKRQEFGNVGNIIIKLSGRGMALVIQWFWVRGFAEGRKRKTFKVSKIIKAFTVSKLLALQKLRHSNSRIQYWVLQGGQNSLHLQCGGERYNKIKKPTPLVWHTPSLLFISQSCMMFAFKESNWAVMRISTERFWQKEKKKP